MRAESDDGPLNMAGWLVVHCDGELMDADTHGSFAAFCCVDCGHPVLADATIGARGSHEEHPAACPRCGLLFFLDVRPRVEKVVIHDMGDIR